MANGLLTGAYCKEDKFDTKTDYRSGMPQFSAKSIDKNQELFRLLTETAARKQATLAQISAGLDDREKPWVVPIPGTRKLHRLQENAGAADIELTSEEVTALDDAPKPYGDI